MKWTHICFIFSCSELLQLCGLENWRFKGRILIFKKCFKSLQQTYKSRQMRFRMSQSTWGTYNDHILNVWSFLENRKKCFFKFFEAPKLILLRICLQNAHLWEYWDTKMKVVIWKPAVAVFWNKTQDISATARDVRNLKIGFCRGDSKLFDGMKILVNKCWPKVWIFWLKCWDRPKNRPFHGSDKI